MFFQNWKLSLIAIIMIPLASITSKILGKRMKLAEKIGQLKKEKNVAVLQSKRWNEILGNMVLEGEQRGLSEEFILRMFKAIHQESINHQEKVMNG